MSDTLSFSEVFSHNIWVTKSIRVNLMNSSLIGVNLAQYFMVMSQNFLHYKHEFLPFKYLSFRSASILIKSILGKC